MKLSRLGLTLLMVATTTAYAELQDGKDLYEKAGPDAAFIRMVSLNDAQFSATIEGEVLNVDGLCSISRTRPVAAGERVLQGEGWRWKHELTSGEIYTVIVDGKQASEIVETLKRDPLKANFEVFNLQASSNLNVATVAGRRSVFEAIPARSRASRTLNPLRVELEIESKSNRVVIDPIAFARGKTTSLMVCAGENTLVSNLTTE
ncbi:MAG: hypothetical protein ACI9E4_000447 [Pseudohongiellaceae bacterium]|jgi:hypothetical protein